MKDALQNLSLVEIADAIRQGSVTSLEAHAALVASLNELILQAARQKLRIDDEPADFDRVILGSKS